MAEAVLTIYPGRDGLPSPSPPCTKVFLALRYCGLPHRVVAPKGDPRRASPTRRLPALALGGEVLCDSVRILDRLEALETPRSWAPKKPRERARDRAWELFANEHLYWRGVYLRWVEPENAARTVRRVLPPFPAPLRALVGRLAVRTARRRARGQGIGLFSRERVRDDVLRALDTYEEALGEGPFLEERDRPGRADFAAAAHLPQFTYAGISPWAAERLRERPRLCAYVGRVYEACDLPAPDGLGLRSEQA